MPATPRREESRKPLQAFLEGPPPPGVRPEALEHAYLVSREGGALVVVRDAAGAETELLRRPRRRGGADWRQAAEAVLGDALEARPTRRLVEDYARFLVTPSGGTRRVSGSELQAWLDTWRSGLLPLVGGGR